MGARATNSDPQPPTPDVSAVLAELREQVRERRARMAISDPSDPHALNLAELRRSADAVNDTWFVSAHLPVTWDLRVVGRLGAYIKRLVRLLLRWYINPIVEQQNRFNSATARAIVEINAYQERMTREWQILEERITKLEKERMEE
ncbi:MAG: hypothetical protein ACJ78Q_06015 [Chloroflexia bacterium]